MFGMTPIELALAAGVIGLLLGLPTLLVVALAGGAFVLFGGIGNPNNTGSGTIFG